MNAQPPILTLHRLFPAEEWPWILLALRQDERLWQALRDPTLISRAQARLGSEGRAWTPCALGFLSLNLPGWEEESGSPAFTIGEELQQQAQAFWGQWHSAGSKVVSRLQGWADTPASPLIEEIEKADYDLGQSFLLAVALKTAYEQRGAWRPVFDALDLDRPPLDTAMACLYGLLAEPLDLLNALLLQGDHLPGADLALHILLSQPQPPEALEQTLGNLLEEHPRRTVLALLERLAPLRPALAERLSGLLLGEVDDLPEDLAATLSGGPGEVLGQLASQWRRAQVYRLTGRPSQAFALMKATWQALHRLREDLAAAMVRLNGHSDIEAISQGIAQDLTDGGQAMAEQAPRNPGYVAALAERSLSAGHFAEAQAALEPLAGERHPALAIAMCRLTHAQGETDLAAQQAQQALALLEEGHALTDEEDYSFLAEVLWQNGAYAEARKVIRHGLSRYPLSRALLLGEVFLGRMLHQPEEALAALYTLQALGLPAETTPLPDGQTLQQARIGLLEGIGAWAEALEERQKWLQSLPNPSLDDWHALMRCAEGAKRWEVLEEAALKALHLNPEDALAHCHLGYVALQKGKPQAAIEHLYQAVRLSPDQPEIWLTLAETYHQIGEETKRIETLRAACQALPDNAALHTQLGEAYLAQNALTQALSAFRRAVEFAPNEENLIHLTKTLVALGRFEEARQFLDPLYHSQPLEALPTELIGTYARVLLGLGEHEGALPLLLEVVRRQPQNAQAALDLVRLLLRSPVQAPRAQQAIPFLQRLLGLSPQGEESLSGMLEEAPRLRAEARALLAEAYSASGQWEAALEAYRRAMEEPENRYPGIQARLASGLGKVALKLAQPQMAVAALQEAAQAEPLNPQIQRLLAEAYWASGLPKEASQAALAAWEVQAEDDEALQWFVEIGQRLLEQSGFPKQALIEALLRAAQALSTRQAPPELLARLAWLQVELDDHAGAIQTLQHLAQVDVIQALSVAEWRRCAQAAEALDDLPLAITFLEKAIARHRTRDDQRGEVEHLAQLVDTLRHLSRLQRATGKHAEALQSLEQALTLRPTDAELHVEKSEIYAHLGDLEAALHSLESALELRPQEPSLHQRAASLLVMKGDLPAALEQAEHGLAIFEKQPPSPELSASSDPALHSTLRQMAAHLAYLTLRPQRAQEHLERDPQARNPLAQAFDQIALRAEIALDAGELPAAEAAVAMLSQRAPEHPRTLAALARLAGQRRDWEEREQRCRSAARLLLQMGLNQTPVTPPSSREAYIAQFLAVAQAAIESRLWEEAQAVLNRLIEIIPETPLAYFKLAQIGVLRAEEQCLCQDCEVVNHAPGNHVLSSQARQEVEAHLLKAQSLLGVTFSPEVAPDFKPWDDECRQALSLWFARARAVFAPDQRAARLLQALLRLLPPDASALAALAMVYRRCGQPQAVEEAIEASWKPASKEQDLRTHPLVLVQRALAAPQAESALALADQALQTALAEGEAWPPLPMLEFLVGRLAYQQGDLVTTLQALQQALAAWPDEPHWQGLAARLYLTPNPELGLPDKVKALTHLEQATAMDASRSEDFLTMGEIYLEGGQVERALVALEQAARLAPQNASLWLALARAYLANRDWEKATMAAERAAGDPSLRAQALLLSGRAALHKGDARRAYSRAQSVLREGQENPEAYHLMAKALETLNRPTEALAALEQALQSSDHSPEMYVQRAQLIRRTQGLEAGIRALQEALVVQPEQAPLLAQLAAWLQEANRPEDALQIARAALQASRGELSDAQRADLHMLIGVHMHKIGQLDQAIHHLNEAIQFAPQAIEAYLELGRVYQERREHRQALKVYQKAMSIAEEDYRPYYQAALALKDSKDYLAAEAMLRRAAQLAPNEVSIHRLLAAVTALNLVHNRRIPPLEPAP